MIRSHYFVPLFFLSSVSGFSVVRRDTCTRGHTTVLSLGQKPISWAEYKQEYVDPITTRPRHDDHTPNQRHDSTDTMQRAKSDEYWLRQFEQDKGKLHQMMEEEQAALAAENSESEQWDEKSETWSHYKHEYIDPITTSSHHETIESHMDPMKRKSADEYWLQWYHDEKERLLEHDKEQ